MEGAKKDTDMKNQNQDDDYDDEDDDEMGDIGELSHTTLPPPTSGGVIQAPTSGGTSNQTMLGGGQYDPMTWDQFYDSRDMVCNGKIPLYTAGQKGTIFLCLHGAGHSAQSFAALARILKQNSTCISFDFRGHGDNTQEDPLVLSVENLVGDTISVIKEICQKYPQQSIILVGHSMGGAIAIKTVFEAQTNHAEEEWTKHIMGLFVIDVVEGTAMEALPFMENIILQRPKKLPSLQSVVQYGLTSNQVRDATSAKVSMPAQVVEKIDDKINKKFYEWKTDLMATKPYWTSWFEGLTQMFLQVGVPKQLLLAGSERMDKDLSIAHMAGKFKMVVIENVGHAIQEDNPLSVSQNFEQFLGQFHIPEKFSDKLVITSISGKQVTIGS